MVVANNEIEANQQRFRWPWRCSGTMRGASPNGSMQWLQVKPWMCSIGQCAPYHTAVSPWPSKSSSIGLIFCLVYFVVGHNHKLKTMFWSI